MDKNELLQVLSDTTDMLESLNKTFGRVTVGMQHYYKGVKVADAIAQNRQLIKQEKAVIYNEQLPTLKVAQRGSVNNKGVKEYYTASDNNGSISMHVSTVIGELANRGYGADGLPLAITDTIGHPGAVNMNGQIKYTSGGGGVGGMQSPNAYDLKTRCIEQYLADKKKG